MLFNTASIMAETSARTAATTAEVKNNCSDATTAAITAEALKNSRDGLQK
jgi:hypothetical protein